MRQLRVTSNVWGEVIDSQLTHTRTRDGFPQIALALEVFETQYGLNMESNFIIRKTTCASNCEAEELTCY